MSATSIEFTRYDPPTRRTFWYCTHPNKTFSMLATYIASLANMYEITRVGNKVHLIPKQLRTD